MKKTIVSVVVLAIAGAGCGGVGENALATTTTTASDGFEEVPATAGEALTNDLPAESDPLHTGATEPPAPTIPEDRAVDEDELPERVPTTSETPVIGEPDSSLVSRIKQDLIGRTGATEADIAVVRSEAVIWSDGSLGCPEPGEMYTQSTVNGFWVVLEHRGVEYDYRATETGYFRLCEGFGAPPSNPTG